MKAYKWGADLDEPVELWSRYDENGDIIKMPKIKDNNLDKIQEKKK